MAIRLLLATIYVLLVPLLARLLPDQQLAIVTGHEFLSSLIVAWILFTFKPAERGHRIFGCAFLLLATADLLYGFAGEIVLDGASVTPSTVAREFSYTSFSALLAAALAWTYRASFRKMTTLLPILALTGLFAWLGFKNIISPLYAMPDRALMFVISGGIYAVFRAFALALAIQRMAFERNMARFLFLYSIAQMFICELAFTFQPNVIDAIKTPLNSWMEIGWQISTATFCAIAVTHRKAASAFGESQTARWNSVRTLTVALVAIVLVVQGAWLWFFGFLNITNLYAVTQLISLGFLGWVLANVFGIAVSSQISRAIAPRETASPEPSTELFTLEENQRTIEHLLTMQRRLDEQKWLAKIGEFSAQIAHDIRSPLSALNLVTATLDNVADDRRQLIRASVARINDIANQLLQREGKRKPAAPSNGSIMLVSVLDAIVSESRLRFRGLSGVRIEGRLGEGYGLFARISESELSRVVANLINNSVEALGGPGLVTVRLSGDREKVSIEVEDSGKGMSPAVLARLGERGFSHGKDGTQSGSGLGVHYARTTIERLGGSFTARSTEGRGTVISLTLASADTPGWFLPKLELHASTNVVSLDDDLTIHRAWSNRLDAEAPGVRHVSFSSIVELDAWLPKGLSANTLLLIDHEFFGETMNGLDVIEKHGLAACSILVTSRHEDESVQRRANALGVRILPKNLLALVPIGLVTRKIASAPGLGHPTNSNAWDDR